jgi:signal transduction histidine kinase
MVFAISQNSSGRLLYSLLICILVIIMVYNELFFIPQKSNTIKFIAISACSVLISLAVSLLDAGNIFIVFCMMGIFQIMRFFNIRVGLIPFVLLLIIRFCRLAQASGNPQLLVLAFVREIWIYTVCFIVLGLIAYILRQNEQLINIRQSLQNQNLETENTYNNLKKAYARLEDYTIMKERSNLSREMHDTVGHTLTSTLVELEMCKMLASEYKENDSLNNHITNVSEQVRKGLYELRTTVSRLKDDVNWLDEIQALVQRLRQNTGVGISVFLNNCEALDNNTLRCCYKVIQEGLTNGLKHGKATEFIINMCKEENTVKLAVIDNGKGCSAFNMGFGLTTMSERVHELCGEISFDGSVEGFSIFAQLPVRSDIK